MGAFGGQLVNQDSYAKDTHARSKALWAAALQEGKAVFEAAGTTEVWTRPQASLHIMSGAVMGDNPPSSVTNSFGQRHAAYNTGKFASSIQNAGSGRIQSAVRNDRVTPARSRFGSISTDGDR